MPQPKILIGVPVYRGEKFVAESLESIREQSYTNYRVLISVDGDGDASAKICRDFLTDHRFEMVVQPERLGWPGNLNWLIRQCREDYFCYWQQDDLASSNYLQSLLARIQSNPSAAMAFCSHVQWFGWTDRVDRNLATSVVGSPASRVLQAIEDLRYEILRGMARRSCLPQPVALAVDNNSNAGSEFAFITRLAACGDLLADDSSVYFKRGHRDSWGASQAQTNDQRRQRWLQIGNATWQAACEVPELNRCRKQLMRAILDRFTIVRTGRTHAYMVSQNQREIGRFVRDFLAETSTLDGRCFDDDDQTETVPVDNALAGYAVDPRVDAAIEAALGGFEPAPEPLPHPTHDGLGRRFARIWGRNSTSLVVSSDGPGLQWLGAGWSYPETWGVWTIGDESTIWMPPRTQTVTLTGTHLAPKRTRCRLQWRFEGETQWKEKKLPANRPITLRFSRKNGSAAHSHQEQRLLLRWPDRVRPANLPDAHEDQSRDYRLVALGLTQIDFRGR